MREAQKCPKQRSAGLSVPSLGQMGTITSFRRALALSHFPSYAIGRSNTNSSITTGQCAPLRKHSWPRPTVGKSHCKRSTHPHHHDNRLSSSRFIPTTEMQKKIPFSKPDRFQVEQDFVFSQTSLTSLFTPAPLPPNPAKYDCSVEKRRMNSTRRLMQPIYHLLPGE